MSINRNTPPLVENMFLLAHERKVRIHIGVAARDIASPRHRVLGNEQQLPVWINGDAVLRMSPLGGFVEAEAHN